MVRMVLTPARVRGGQHEMLRRVCGPSQRGSEDALSPLLCCPRASLRAPMGREMGRNKQTVRDKQMERFAREAFRLGSLKGFRHFGLELRGREELMLTVWPNAPAAQRPGLERMGTNEALPPASPYFREVNRRVWEAYDTLRELVSD